MSASRTPHREHSARERGQVVELTPVSPKRAGTGSAEWRNRAAHHGFGWFEPRPGPYTIAFDKRRIVPRNQLRKSGGLAKSTI